MINKMKVDKQEMEESVMTERMRERINKMNELAYQFLVGLLEVDQEKAKIAFPMSKEMTQTMVGYAVSILNRSGYSVCEPYIITQGDREVLCTLSDCGCGECHYQDEFMEKERILARIEEAMECNGLTVVEGSSDATIVEEALTGSSFKISVEPIPSKEKR